MSKKQGINESIMMHYTAETTQQCIRELNTEHSVVTVLFTVVFLFLFIWKMQVFIRPLLISSGRCSCWIFHLTSPENCFSSCELL